MKENLYSLFVVVCVLGAIYFGSLIVNATIHRKMERIGVECRAGILLCNLKQQERIADSLEQIVQHIKRRDGK